MDISTAPDVDIQSVHRLSAHSSKPATTSSMPKPAGLHHHQHANPSGGPLPVRPVRHSPAPHNTTGLVESPSINWSIHPFKWRWIPCWYLSWPIYRNPSRWLTIMHFTRRHPLLLLLLWLLTHHLCSTQLRTEGLLLPKYPILLIILLSSNTLFAPVARIAWPPSMLFTPTRRVVVVVFWFGKWKSI